MTPMPQRPSYAAPPLAREPMAVVEGGQSPSVLALLTRMRASAFQGRQLGEAFETWKRMIEGPSLICLGYAASLSSAGLWPLVTWLLDRGYERPEPRARQGRGVAQADEEIRRAHV